MNHPGSGTINLWFTTSVGADAGVVLAIGAGIPACVLDIFCFGCPTDGASFSLLSSSSSLPVSLASDFVFCMFCSLNSS